MPQHPKDRFIRNNLIVFTGSFVIAIISYLYYPVLARVMSVHQFGEVQTLVTIFNQAALIFSAINIVTVVLVASSKNVESNTTFILELQKLMVYLVGLLGIIVLVFAPQLRSFFQFDNAWPFLAIVLALVANVPFAFWTSYLQGKESFFGMSLLGFLGAAGKLVFSVALVIIGWKTFGAILGLFLGQLMTLLYISRKYELPSIRLSLQHGLPKWSILKTELAYTGLVFAVTLIVSLLYSGDILLVKHFLNANDAGIYAGISSIARVIFFLTLPFAVVLLPSIQHNWDRRNHLLKRSLAMTLVLGGLTCLVFWLAKREVVSVMIGSRYLSQAYLLPKLSLAIFLISISNLIFYFLLSARSVRSLLVALVGLSVFLGTSITHHQSADSIVNNLFLSAAITTILLLLELSVWPRLRGKLSDLSTLRKIWSSQ